MGKDSKGPGFWRVSLGGRAAVGVGRSLPPTRVLECPLLSLLKSQICHKGNCIDLTDTDFAPQAPQGSLWSPLWGLFRVTGSAW